MTKPINDRHLIRKVHLNTLQFDDADAGGYQRGDKHNQKRIAKNFNRAAAGVLHVGNRGEQGLFCIDGKQRCKAMISLGIKEWDAVVIPSSGREYEAAIYSILNGKDRMALTKMELFRGQLAANDPIALAVKQVCEEAGYRIKAAKGGSRGHGEIACVATLYRICARKNGEALLKWCFGLLEEVWPKQPENMKDTVIAGLCLFATAHANEYNADVLKKTLLSVTPRQILLDSSLLSGNRAREFYRAIRRLYNRKCRAKANKLKLHSEEDAA